MGLFNNFNQNAPIDDISRAIGVVSELITEFTETGEIETLYRAARKCRADIMKPIELYKISVQTPITVTYHGQRFKSILHVGLVETISRMSDIAASLPAEQREKIISILRD